VAADGVKKYSDVKTAFAFVFGPYDHSLAFDGIIFAYPVNGYRQGQLDHDFGERGYIFFYAAIRADATDIPRSGDEIIAVSRDFKRKVLVEPGVQPSLRF